jgi:GNAT superfamily N-acetyltransferase
METHGNFSPPPMPRLGDWKLLTRSGLRLEMTTRFDSEIFERFFEAYDRAFILPNEKEEKSGFQGALALNQGSPSAQLVHTYGPFREVCLLAFDGPMVVGGANFFATVATDRSGGQFVTSNLNYVYTTPEQRGRGYFRQLLDSITQVIQDLFVGVCGSAAPVLVFIEQNDPFRLSGAQYELDTRVSGVDQFERLYIWARVGARLLIHPYVQPALSDSQAADETLVYSVLDKDRTTVDPELLRHHLERFFAVSILKGQPLETRPIAVAQLARLDELAKANQTIGVFDPTLWLAKFVAQTDRFAQWVQRPKSLIEAMGLLRNGA